MTIYGVEWSFTEGDYRFDVGFDSGNSCGLDQRDVDVSQRTPLERMSLAHFTGPQLLAAYRGEDRASRADAFAADEAHLHAQCAAERATLLSASARKRLKYQEKHGVDRLQAALAKALRTLPRETFDLAQLHAVSRQWDQGRHLRSFYFDEVNERHIRNFGGKYVADSTYRAQVDAGTTVWARRNELFERNLFALPLVAGALDASVAGSPVAPRPLWATSAWDMEVAAEPLWRWVCQHAAAVSALPAFQALQQRDSVDAPQASELDREIADAVDLWNTIPGVRTRFSCQGVSGTISYAERRILVPSQHEPFAYIAFEAMDPETATVITQLASSFPSIAINGVRGSAEFTLAPDAPHLRVTPTPERINRLTSRDPDTNLAFREEVRALAEQVRAQLHAE